MVQRGAFIVFEGLDRCGKTTQADLLHKKIPNAIQLAFPDRSTGLGKYINGYLKSKESVNDQSIHLVFSANRWEKKYVLHCF